MKGDFSRFTFDPAKGYSAVRMQQGRVQLDADWNEHVDIVAHRLRCQAIDLIGATGAPAGGTGFEILPRSSVRFDGRGRYATIGHAPIPLYGAAPGFTVEAVVRTRSGAPGGTLLSRWEKPDAESPLRRAYLLEILADGLLRFHRGGRVADLESDLVVGPEGWVTVALSHDREETALFIDGRPAGRAAEGFRVESLGTVFLVGAAQLGEDPHPGFDGWLGEVRMWGEARAARDLAAAAGPEPTSPTPGLIGRWRFDRATGAVVLDRSPHGNHALLGGGRPAARPELELDGLEIGAGRYYAGGLLCERAATGPLDRQPDLPGTALPADRGPGRSYLFYLDAWERHVSALQDPDLLEPALGGADTATRSKVVAQVRWLPVELDEIPPDAGAGVEEWTELVRRSQGRGRLAVRVAAGGYDGLENRLYRVEVHRPGGIHGRPRTAAELADALEVETALPSVQQVILAPGAIESLAVNDWVELFGESGEAQEPGLAARVSSLDAGSRALTLDRSISELEDGGALRVRRLATFKWSRDNGAAAAPIARLDARVAALGPHPRPEPLFAPGAWAEVVDDHSILAGAAHPLLRVEDFDASERAVTFFEPAPEGVGRRAELHPLLVRWEGVAPIRSGEWLALEGGLEVRFVPSPEGRPGYRSGDFWTFAARSATAGIDWPVEAAGEPAARPPRGIDHHLSPLAVLRFEERGFELRDCRPVFQPLTTGAVSKAGDRMHGPLEIRPEDRERPALAVAGTAQADTFLGALGSPAAVESFNLAAASVTRSKIAPDVGTVPPGYAILGDGPIPPPGYEYSGCSLMVPDPDPRWVSRAVLRVGDEAGELHSAAAGGRVYTFSDVGRVWRYDPATGALDERQSMPEPRGRFAVAGAGGKVYVVGGVDHQGKRVAAVLEYDPAADGWSWRQEMPTPRSDLGLAVAEGKIFALGGLRNVLFFETASDRNEVYDPEVDAWSRRRSMPRARFAMTAGASGRGVFAFGGRRRWFFRWLGRVVDAASEEYLPGVDRWVRRPTLMPAPHSHGAAAPVGDAIFVIGGRSLFGWTAETARFTPKGDGWEPGPTLPAPLSSPGVAALDGRIVVHGAGSEPGTLEVRECRIASHFYVHRKAAAPESELEPQLGSDGD